jgi:hypothetical protein
MVEIANPGDRRVWEKPKDIAGDGSVALTLPGRSAGYAYYEEEDVKEVHVVCLYLRVEFVYSLGLRSCQETPEVDDQTDWIH